MGGISIDIKSATGRNKQRSRNTDMYSTVIDVARISRWVHQARERRTGEQGGPDWEFGLNWGSTTLRKSSVG